MSWNHMNIDWSELKGKAKRHIQRFNADIPSSIIGTQKSHYSAFNSVSVRQDKKLSDWHRLLSSNSQSNPFAESVKDKSIINKTSHFSQ